MPDPLGNLTEASNLVAKKAHRAATPPSACQTERRLKIRHCRRRPAGDEVWQVSAGGGCEERRGGGEGDSL